MCIDLQMLSAYMDGELKEPYRTQVKEHLEHCAACRNLLENMKKLDEKIQKDRFSEEELNRNKDAIFKKLDAKCFGNGKQISFFRRKICFSIWATCISTKEEKPIRPLQKISVRLHRLVREVTVPGFSLKCRMVAITSALIVLFPLPADGAVTVPLLLWWNRPGRLPPKAERK